MLKPIHHFQCLLTTLEENNKTGYSFTLQFHTTVSYHCFRLWFHTIENRLLFHAILHGIYNIKDTRGKVPLSGCAMLSSRLSNRGRFQPPSFCVVSLLRKITSSPAPPFFFPRRNGTSHSVVSFFCLAAHVPRTQVLKVRHQGLSTHHYVVLLIG